MKREEAFIINQNRHYWDTYADLWFGATALPTYGVCFATENELHLFGDVSGKKLLEICCGSGHSLKYHAERNAGELWGVDFSQKQLENAKQYLRENGYSAKLICSPMEADMDIPNDYFDFVYSIYGIGWTTDLDGTLKKIASLYYRVVVIRAPLQGLCYTVRDAVDWCVPPTTRWFQKGSNHSPLHFC